MRLLWPITEKVKDSQAIEHHAIEHQAIEAKTPKIVENKKILHKTCKTLQLGNNQNYWPEVLEMTWELLPEAEGMFPEQAWNNCIL
jgi:hypothetical protein